MRLERERLIKTTASATRIPTINTPPPIAPPRIAASWLRDAGVFWEGVDDEGDVMDDVDVVEVDTGKGNEDNKVSSMVEVSV